MAQAKVTTNHDDIRKWAEARGGSPATVRSTHTKDNPGIIRIEFPGAPNANDDALEEISWEEFFEKFDEAHLALLYQEKTARAQQFQQDRRPRDRRSARTRRNPRQPPPRQALRSVP